MSFFDKITQNKGLLFGAVGAAVVIGVAVY